VTDGTILYVDDDEANLTVLQATCADEFDVITASSGAEALDILQQREIAVLLVDQRMPVMTGVELFETIREQYRDTVRILITAYSDITSAISAINRGQVRRYIKKPWEPEELKAILAESLEIYATRRQVRELEQRFLETERVYALGVIAASVAHELRTPLTALQANLDLARMRGRKLAEQLQPGARVGPPEHESLGKLLDQVGGAAAAAGQAIDITRGVELGHRRRDDEQVADLSEVVNLTLKCVRGDLLTRSQLFVEAEPHVAVAASPTKVGQVVLNLLINAFQALPERPRNENLVTIRVRPGSDAVTLEVEDNGSGIPREVVERIFDPFFTTKAQGGTGLGLAISRKIVEEARGSIAVDSTPGRGTRFTVTLPPAAPG
jgi:signal transduction histidine kinase